MADMTAFECQLAARLELIAGPEPQVDAMASARSAMTVASTRRPFAMISALKLVAAAAIVALFGGFLLAGVLTAPQGDEVVPAAVSASPTTEAEPEEATQPPDSQPSPMTTEELLSGMVTEEVEPGVLRVINDGVRDLSEESHIVAAYDGGVYFFGSFNPSGEFFRLGDEARHALHGEKVESVAIGTDGIVWENSHLRKRYGKTPSTRRHLYSYDGERWTVRRESPKGGEMRDVEVAPDGTVWAMWSDYDRGRTVLGRLDGDGWRTEEVPHDGDLSVTDTGDLWLLDNDDRTYRRMRGEDEWSRLEASAGAAGPDGTAWASRFWWLAQDDCSDLDPGVGLTHFDGTEWREWACVDGEPVPGSMGLFDVAPDGSLWAGAQSWQVPDAPQCAGLLNFDGETLTYYLKDLCVHGGDIGPDGTVWVQAGSGRIDGEKVTLDKVSTYVITPEAVAATE